MQTGASRPTSGVPNEWKWHHETLMSLRDVLVRFLAESNRPPDGQRDSDWFDVATMEPELADCALEDSQIAEVEAALDRRENGTYGTRPAEANGAIDDCELARTSVAFKVPDSGDSTEAPALRKTVRIGPLSV